MTVMMVIYKAVDWQYNSNFSDFSAILFLFFS